MKVGRESRFVRADTEMYSVIQVYGDLQFRQSRQPSIMRQPRETGSRSWTFMVEFDERDCFSGPGCRCIDDGPFKTTFIPESGGCSFVACNARTWNRRIL